MTNEDNHEQEEAVPESLKNILLVMSSGGYLAPPDQKPEQEELWRETWTKLDRFLPNLLPELFPEEAEKKQHQGHHKRLSVAATASARPSVDAASVATASGDKNDGETKEEGKDAEEAGAAAEEEKVEA